MPNPPTLRSPMLGRSPMFGGTPARSPANSSSAGTRTPGTWTPTILSPRSPAFPAYPSSTSNAASGSTYPYPPPYPLSTGTGGMSAARDGGGSGRVGSGRIGSAFDAMFGALPTEEDAVRKALGLPPAVSVSTDAEEGGIGSLSHRHRPGQGNSQGHREGSADGFEGHDGGGRAEGGGGRSESESESERRCRQVIQAPGRAPLCLLLSNLGELFRWDAAAAADMCADAFPGVRPW